MFRVLGDLRDEDLENLIKLEILSLSNTNITGECFKYLINLKSLYLMNCNNLKVENFTLLNNLKKIDYNGREFIRN